jgi:hypothetical protein
MGRLLLSALVGLVLWGCESGAPEASAPHANLSCAACHDGPRGDRGRATVPEASCTASGCHESRGPEEVRMATVTFPHRDHGEDGAITLSCAGCHTHENGDAPLRASVEGCALCHVGEVMGAEAQECRLCHVQPDHSRLTSQGVAISHSQLPWLEIGCVRCHYDVAEASPDVSGASCRHCHVDLTALNEEAVGRDLHPIHDGVTCTSCHAAGVHEVKAMSSVVQLVCSDCHREAHGLLLEPEPGAGPQGPLCGECHTGIHAPQQQLILGIRPDGTVTPSAKFLAGITCRSCHVPPPASGASEGPLRGQATACAGCHDQRYAQVLDWWIEGLNARLASTSAYIERATREIGAPSDSARSLLEIARRMVSLVQEAGGQHNLELSDRLMREALGRTRSAYALAGVPPPPAPDLGRVPHTGLCSYCHYRPSEPWDFDAMPEDFHESVMSDEE